MDTDYCWNERKNRKCYNKKRRTLKNNPLPKLEYPQGNKTTIGCYEKKKQITKGLLTKIKYPIGVMEYKAEVFFQK